MPGKYGSRNGKAPHSIGEDEPLAIRLLKEEHHVFRSLFDEAGEAKGGRRIDVAREICMRLAVHMTIEEEILYPALEPLLGKDEINEGIVEHASGKALVAEIEQLNGDEELFDAKVHVLGEETVHHIDEEDEKMFAEATGAHKKGEIDLDALGEKLRARQAQLYDQLAETGEIGKTREAKANAIESV